MNHPDHPQALPSPDRRAMASFMRILGASGCAVAAIAWIACADQTATAWLITVALTWLALSILGGETATLSPSRRLRDRVRDAALVGVLAWSVDPAASLWAMPEAWHQVPTLTHGAATLIAATFLFASLAARARRQAALAHPAVLAFLAVPVGFNLLLLLGNNTLLAQWGQALAGPILHPAAHAAVGRALLLGGINLTAVWEWVSWSMAGRVETFGCWPPQYSAAAGLHGRR